MSQGRELHVIPPRRSEPQTFLYREVSPDALQIPPLKVEIRA